MLNLLYSAHERATILSDSCMLRVGILGINFKTASLELREQIARAVDILSTEKTCFFRCPLVILSTCNRTEIYFAASDLASIHSDLLAWLRSTIQEPFTHYLYSYFGIDCFTHLCKVTAGLDSAIVAETEIQGQVKVAYESTAKKLPLPSVLHYIFQKSLKIAKMVRSQYFSSQRGSSLFGMIWHLASSFFDDLFAKNILFIGYSELNRRLAKAFLHRGAKRLSFCTKHPESFSSLDYHFYGRDILENWSLFDLMICATKAEHYLIEGPGCKGRLIFDLSMPRNIDPSVAEKSKLYNIEEMNLLIERQRKEKQMYLTQSEEILKTHVQRLAFLYQKKQQLKRAFCT